MLDAKVVRENPDMIRQMLTEREVQFPLDRLLEVDGERRRFITETQELKRKKNLVSEEIATRKKRGADPSKTIQETKEITERIDSAAVQIKKLDAEFKELMLRLPNIPHESVPIGKDETGNVEVRKWGIPRLFDFPAKDHIVLGEERGLIDVERAAKVSGARFYYLKGDLVRLNYALIQFALGFMKGMGYTIVQPPYFLKRNAYEGTVILSDFEDVIYKVEGEDLYLIATSEHAIAAMHMNEVLEAGTLPLRYAGISPCFRKEAGAHGRDTKGIFRVHQFEKVEQFVYTKPEDSWNEIELMIANAEEIFRLLELPHRVLALCTGDLGKVSAKTYDIEVWLPSQGKYREVVSCSNCTDYQTRSLGIKFREKPHEQSKFLHTLNSTLVATERALIAILENHQIKDGRVRVPGALQGYMGGQEYI